MSKKYSTNYTNFQSVLPRSIYGQSSFDETGSIKTAGVNSVVGGVADIAALGMLGTQRGTTYWNASRRFYDPQITTTAIYLPRTIKQKNRWRRWFYDHDELVGAVLDIHAELPYSRAEVMCDDNLIKNHVLECFDRTQFFSMLPLIDLEYLKIGEVFIHTPWDATKGMWSHIIIHNPDFVQISSSPFADQEYVIELIPDDELRSLLNSTKPQDQMLKKKISPEIVRRVLSGKNILLNTEEVTHIARRSNPYDIRGTSILDRIFRLLMYEDKLREAQITIADNFIYPLKIFKLGDPQKGWIPNESHQKALAQMLQQSTFDPNFALIYHYALDVAYVTVADKVMKLDREWDEITKKKMIALGVSQQFVTGETSYATANVALQTQLSRYRAKRDLFEVRWITNKFLRVMAERNNWYRRDRREIVGQYRVKRTGAELEDRLIIPKLIWHKKLMMRDDQAFLTFMNNVYAQGRGPISALTLLQAMGLDLEDELNRKKHQEKLEEKIGVYIQPPSVGPMGTVSAKLENWWNRRKGKKQPQQDEVESTTEEKDFELTGSPDINLVYANHEDIASRELQLERATLSHLEDIDSAVFHKNLKSPFIPTYVSANLKNIQQYASSNFNKSTFLKDLEFLYMQGKLYTYEKTQFTPYNEHPDLKDYSDLLLCKSFNEWVDNIITSPSSENLDIVTASGTKSDVEVKVTNSKCITLAISAFIFGQLKGYEEQGIYHVKISNVFRKDGEIYDTKSLLSMGSNVGFLLSPTFEVPLFTPCIEGFDTDDFENQVDTQIQRKKTFPVNDIQVINCPIEIIDETKNLLNKLSKIISKKYVNVVEFIDDITNAPEWESSTINKIRASLDINDSDTNQTTTTFLISSRLHQERLKSRNICPIFVAEDKKKIYVATWSLQKPLSFTRMFIDNFPFISDTSLSEKIRKGFSVPSFDLTPEEIDVYAALELISPIYDQSYQITGYQVNPTTHHKDSNYIKLRNGKTWGAGGKCKNAVDKDPVEYFMDNVFMWIRYPHFLDKEATQSFESIKG